MTPIRVFIPGVPQGKGRARTRVVHANGRAFAAHYTPAKTRTYEGVIATAGSTAMNGAPPMTCPVRLEIVAVVPVPASWPNWKRAAALRGDVLPTTKPDMDNVEKALLDGFNEVIWKDDVQVVRCVKEKRYGELPGVTVHVTPLEAQAAQEARKVAA
jgi:Holliday junction resolvase RusA-like endonuclease